MAPLLLFLLAGGGTAVALVYAHKKQSAATPAPTTLPPTYTAPLPGSTPTSAMPSLFMPSPNQQPTPPSPPPQSREVLDDPVPVYPGKHYSATIQTSGLLAGRANESSIRSQAESRGFTGVQVFNQMPSGWPGTTTGDWYVSATYSGSSPSSFQRSNSMFLLGSANIVDVWES